MAPAIPQIRSAAAATSGGERVVHLPTDAVDQPLGDRRDDVVAGLEVEVERALRHARRAHDVVHGGGADALGRERPDRGVHEIVAAAGAPAGGGGRRGGPACVSCLILTDGQSVYPLFGDDGPVDAPTATGPRRSSTRPPRR